MSRKIYDVFINGVGYALAKTQQPFTSSIATPLAPKQVQGDYALSDFELYSIIAQSDFRGGAGQLDLDDVTKYAWGYRVDTRGERVSLGVKMDTTQPNLTYDAAGTVGQLDLAGGPINLAFAWEPGDQTNAWQTLDGTTTRLAVPVSNATGADSKLYHIYAYLRSLTGIDNSTLKLALYTDSSGSPGTKVDDTPAISANDITYHGAWLSGYLNAGQTMTAGTSYWLVVDFVSGSSETVQVLTGTKSGYATVKTFDGSSWTGLTDTWAALVMSQLADTHPPKPVVKFVQFKGAGKREQVYALTGRRLYRIVDKSTLAVVMDGANPRYLNYDGSDMIVVMNPGDSAPSLLVARGNLLLHGASVWPLLYYDGNYDSPTWTTLTNNERADHLTMHDHLTWRGTTNNVEGVFVQGTSDFTDFTTSGVGGPKVLVGDRSSDIKALFSWNGNLYAGKLDGLYVITYADTYPAASASIQANKVIDLSGQVHENNFRCWEIWQGDLYFSVANGLARYTTSGVLSSVSAQGGLLVQASLRDRFVALHATLTQLYAVLESGVDDWTSIMVYTGQGWHSLATSGRTGDLGGALFVDSGLYDDLPRIWTSFHGLVTSFAQPTWSLRRWTFSDGTSSSPVEYFDRTPGSYMSECEGQLYSSWISGGLKTIQKQWNDLTVLASNLSASYYIKVYYRLTEDGSWTSLGTIQTEPMQKLTFPAATLSRRLQLRFDLYTTESQNSPLLWAYSVRYLPRPTVKQRFQMTLQIGENIELANGAREQKSLATQWTNLVTARSAESAIALVDPEGNSTQVNIEQLFRQRLPSQDVAEGQAAYSVTVVAVEA